MKSKNRFESKVRAFIQDHEMFKDTDRLIVGVSGGADSMGLLFYLSTHHAGPVLAVHVHHGIRGRAADEDARLVKTYCAQKEIPCEIEHVDVPALAKKEKLSLELAGRQARRYIFSRLMQQKGGDRLVLAHHMNDQAETVLMRLIRGTGVSGAAGIRPVSGRTVRPFLCVKKNEIEDYCREKGVPFRVDQTNYDPEFTRNAIRHEMLPQMEKINGKAVNHLAGFADIAEAYQKEIDYWRDTLMARWVKTRADGRIALKLHEWHRASPLMQEAIVRKCLIQSGHSMVDVEKRHVALILNRLRDQGTTWDLDMPHGVEVSRRYEVLYFNKSAAVRIKQKYTAFPGEYAVEPKLNLDKTAGPWRIHVRWGDKIQKNDNKTYLMNEIFLNYGRIKKDLWLRGRKPGDLMKIPGVGTRKVKKFLIDRKVDRDVRAALPFLAAGSRVLWIPGIWKDRSVTEAGSPEDLWVWIGLEKCID
ncbi:tRNA lysidine(34) synthetase TilS [Pseudoramibacter sp.]|uniref:tRNA lysidine(34) synthetase TilS n=1 Tax=Pseudoramibacter sp. TaxID=2034862 RepID=UPI0025F4D1B2|nr:tRNA lysidine(34) synthetase TilS [Pseudoramibacter sp.]MCH4071487.1 tRNA lysidine(34) synthetase TilS [Pseudoramibacter sp.]MCH4105255.1 tRNA lysidine(34) synthetase TilS [Pseudoramibacter sp.]